MLSPLPRRSDWGTASLTFPQSCQPSPVREPGRPAHRHFRGLLGVHSRYGLHTRAVTVFRDTLIRRLQPFRLLHSCSGCFRLERLPGGICTHWKSAALSRRTPKAAVGFVADWEACVRYRCTHAKTATVSVHWTARAMARRVRQHPPDRRWRCRRPGEGSARPAARPAPRARDAVGVLPSAWGLGK